MNKLAQIVLAVALTACVTAYPQHGGYLGGYGGDESAISYADGGGGGGGESSDGGEHSLGIEGDAAGGGGGAYGDSHGHDVDYHAPAHYSFEYDVHDPHTGDVKSQHEERKGDDVKGFYTVKEADGTTREVHYTADKHNGFNAVVKRTGHASHPQHYKTGDDH